MPVSSRRSPPKYRHFKPKNLAVVRIKGRDHYLGKYDTAESWQKYYQLLAQDPSTANGSIAATPTESPGTFIGISKIIEAYLEFARTYYSTESIRTTELDNLEYALEPLSDLFGLANAHTFGPKSLMLVRQHMINLGWSRKLINSRVNRIKRCFKWAVSQEMVSPTVLLGLQAVQGLRRGRSAARETEPIKPVADEHVDATLPFLTPVVRTMAATPLATVSAASGMSAVTTRSPGEASSTIRLSAIFAPSGTSRVAINSDLGTRIDWFATNVSLIFSRSAVRYSSSLISTGQASASTQICIWQFPRGPSSAIRVRF